MYEFVHYGFNSYCSIYYGIKCRLSFTKSPSLVLIGPIESEIQPFENVKFYTELYGHPDAARTQRPDCHTFSLFITYGAKLLNADWLRQRAFFLNHEGTFGNQEGMIT